MKIPRLIGIIVLSVAGTLAGPAAAPSSAQTTETWSGTWQRHEISGTLTLADAVGAVALPLRSYGFAAPNTWSGTWSSNFGTMELVQTGSHVEGKYTYDDGHIQGTVTGNVLNGTWDEAPTRTPPKDAGEIEFILADNGQSFIGSWPYDSTGAWGDWSGTCAGGSCLQNDVAMKCLGEEATIVGQAVLGAPIFGTPNPDVIVGTPEFDVILGGGGRDTICSLGGEDHVNGGGGGDRISGGAQNDDLIGGVGLGQDHIEGGAGEDKIQGGGGRDFLERRQRERHHHRWRR